VKLIQAWAKAVSFGYPSPSMVDDVEILGASSNNTLDLMCSLFASHGRCLKACAASNDNVYKAALAATPSFDKVCTDKQADFDRASPCLSANTAEFQQVCQSDNEDLLAASVRLSVMKQLEREVLRDYCRSASVQSFCVFPLVRQRCGDAAYDAIRSIINATLVGVRVSVGEKAILDFYPECDGYVNSVWYGSPITLENGTLFNITTDSHATGDSTTASHHTTIAPVDLDNTTLVENTTQLLVRDDAGGPAYDPEGGRFNSASPRFQSTTTASSDAVARRSFKNAMALFTFSIIFCIFL
jgi:hypothetical protein